MSFPLLFAALTGRSGHGLARMGRIRSPIRSASYYVDKTPWIERLVNEGKHFFLSWPRRFGKSLLIDTMNDLFEGNEPLFRGLAVHDRWDWTVRWPVLRLGFGSGSFSEPGDTAPVAHE